MSATEIGLGSITFGSVFVGIFDAETGFSRTGASVPAVNVQKDADAFVAYCAGDSKDYGTVNASIQLTAGLDIDAIVSTSETLTVTLPSGDTYTASAFLQSGPTTTGANAKVLAACVFQWEAVPVFAAAP
jgi:hypothetical protein